MHSKLLKLIIHLFTVEKTNIYSVKKYENMASCETNYLIS